MFVRFMNECCPLGKQWRDFSHSTKPSYYKRIQNVSNVFFLQLPNCGNPSTGTLQCCGGNSNVKSSALNNLITKKALSQYYWMEAGIKELSV